MTFLVPWAWVGLVAVGVPILVHWLARRRADRVRFPTLQFLPATPPASVRRTRLTDAALLALRAAIAATAVAALAQPAWLGPRARGEALARAVIVDSSASMGRRLADGRAAPDAASGAAMSTVIEVADLRTGIARAATWLERQPGAREVVIVSDFQVGALAAGDLDQLPADVGVRFVRVPVAPGSVSTPPGPGGVLRVYVAPADAARAAAAEASARATSFSETTPEVVLVFPGAPERASLTARARAVDRPEQYRVLDTIRQNELLRHLAPDLTSGVVSSESRETTPDVVLVPLFSNKTGGVLVAAAALDDPAGLVLLANVDPGSLFSAALMAAVIGASAATPGWLAEREPDSLGPETLQSWRRDPQPSAGTATPESGGRWLWGLALAGLALEGWVRRARAGEPMREASHVRAA